MLPRPSFASMLRQFSLIYSDGELASVGNIIGGHVQKNIELGLTDPAQGFTNACAIRMSYCLNYSGVVIGGGLWKTVSGADHMWYIFRISDLFIFLTHKFGKPDKIVNKPQVSDFRGVKGILIFKVPWSDASGHATLWDGVSCSDHCYFPDALEASIWLLN